MIRDRRSTCGDSLNSTTTQRLASIFVSVSVAKLIAVLIDPHAWIRAARRIYARPQITGGIALAAAGAVLVPLIRSGLDIVQILAVCLFVVLVIVVGLAPRAPQLFDWIETQDVHQIVKRQWPYAVVWTGILSWGADTLLSWMTPDVRFSFAPATLPLQSNPTLQVIDRLTERRRCPVPSVRNLAVAGRSE